MKKMTKHRMRIWTTPNSMWHNLQLECKVIQQQRRVECCGQQQPKFMFKAIHHYDIFEFNYCFIERAIEFADFVICDLL